MTLVDQVLPMSVFTTTFGKETASARLFKCSHARHRCVQCDCGSGADCVWRNVCRSHHPGLRCCHLLYSEILSSHFSLDAALGSGGQVTAIPPLHGGGCRNHHCAGSWVEDGHGQREPAAPGAFSKAVLHHVRAGPTLSYCSVTDLSKVLHLALAECCPRYPSGSHRHCARRLCLRPLQHGYPGLHWIGPDQGHGV